DAAAEALDACCALDRGSDPPAIRPEHVLANRGELNLRRNDLAAAADAFRAARALDPASSYLCERLGRVHELAGDMTAAEAAYREAAALPRGAFAYLALGRLQARVTGDLAGAVAALVEALRRVPTARAGRRRRPIRPFLPRSPRSQTRRSRPRAASEWPASSIGSLRRKDSASSAMGTASRSSFTSRSARTAATESRRGRASPSSS